MIKIDIEVETREELIQALDIIKGQIQQGNTSGFYPTWDLSGEEEPGEEEEEEEE